MARIRTIKPEFFTSLTVANLTVEARLTFIGLWTHVDDDGRAVDDARLIKAAVWPLDDRVAADIERDLQALTDASLIVRYKVGGRSYLAVRTWREHQRINRPTKSKLPPPPTGSSPAGQRAGDAAEDHTPPAETAGQSGYNPRPDESSRTTHAHLSEISPLERNREQGTGNREQGGEAPQAAQPRQRGTRLPEDFRVDDSMKAWFHTHCPKVDGARETLKFRNYWAAKSGKDATKLDWVKTWQNWMLRAAEDVGRRPGNAVARVDTDRRPSTTDQRVAAGLALAAKYDAMEEAS
jgi:hypothetical protein